MLLDDLTSKLSTEVDINDEGELLDDDVSTPFDEETEPKQVDDTEKKEVDKDANLTPEQKQAKHWQRVATEKDKQLKEALARLSPPKEEVKVEIPTKPKLPAKPQGYSKLDAIQDEDSESAKYELALEEYQNNLAKYLDYKDEQENKTVAEKQAENTFAKLKAEKINEFVALGRSKEEAQLILDWSLNTTPTADVVAQLFDIVHKTPGQGKKQSQQRNVPPPPGRGSDNEYKSISDQEINDSLTPKAATKKWY